MNKLLSAFEEDEKKEKARVKSEEEELFDSYLSGDLSLEDLKEYSKDLEGGADLVEKASKCNSYTWGLDSIDSKITNPKRGNLFILVSDENQGKSTFCYFFARANHKKYGHDVVYYNLEQTKEEVIDSTARQHAGITKLQYRDDNYRDNAKYKEKVRELREEKSINFIGRKADEMVNIDSVIKEIKEMDKVDYLIIDNLSCISMSGRDSNEETKEIIIKLNALAKEKNIPIVLVHHYRKDSGARKSIFRSTSEINGSGAIKNLAFGIIQVARHFDEEDPVLANDFYIREGKMRNADKKESVKVIHSKGLFIEDTQAGFGDISF